MASTGVAVQHEPRTQVLGRLESGNNIQRVLQRSGRTKEPRRSGRCSVPAGLERFCARQLAPPRRRSYRTLDGARLPHPIVAGWRRLVLPKEHGGDVVLRPGRRQCPKSPLATDNLLENTGGVLRPHQCSLGTAACYLLFYADARYIDAVIGQRLPRSGGWCNQAHPGSYLPQTPACASRASPKHQRRRRTRCQTARPPQNARRVANPHHARHTLSAIRRSVQTRAQGTW